MIELGLAIGLRHTMIEAVAQKVGMHYMRHIGALHQGGAKAMVHVGDSEDARPPSW